MPYMSKLTIFFFAHLENIFVEFVEQCSHLLSSSNIGRVVKKKRLQLANEGLFNFHYKRSFTLPWLRHLAMGQTFEFWFRLESAVRCFTLCTVTVITFFSWRKYNKMTVRRMRKGSRYKHNAWFGEGGVPYCHISAIWLPIAVKVMVLLVHCSGVGYGNLTQE